MIFCASFREMRLVAAVFSFVSFSCRMPPKNIAGDEKKGDVEHVADKEGEDVMTGKENAAVRKIPCLSSDDGSRRWHRDGSLRDSRGRRPARFGRMQRRSRPPVRRPMLSGMPAA